MDERLVPSWLRVLALWMAVVLTVTSVPWAAMADTRSDVESMEKAFGDLDYEAANKAAERLAKSRGLTHDQLVRTYRILARTYAFLDKPDQARDAFFALLTFEPDEKVDTNLPPKVQTAMLEARGNLRALGTRPGIEVAAALSAHNAGTLRVTTRDPTHVVKKVAVGHRWGPSGAFTTAIVAPGEGVAVEVPAPPANVLRLEYYVQALDDRDDAVFEHGTATAPKSAAADAPSTTPTTPGTGTPGTPGGGGAEKGSSFLGSPVFWVVTALVVVGAGLTAYFATRKGDETVRPPTMSNLFPSLTCGSDRCR